MKDNKNILCVDDNHDTNEILTIFFQQQDYKVISCSVADACFQQLKNTNFTAIILDGQLQETDGITICRTIRLTNKTIPIIFFSADARESSRKQALESGANAYLIKPNDLENIVQVVLNFIKNPILPFDSKDVSEKFF